MLILASGAIVLRVKDEGLDPWIIDGSFTDFPRQNKPKVIGQCNSFEESWPLC